MCVLEHRISIFMLSACNLGANLIRDEGCLAHQDTQTQRVALKFKHDSADTEVSVT